MTPPARTGESSKGWSGSKNRGRGGRLLSWPFRAVWRWAGHIEKNWGILPALIGGVALMAVGYLFTATIIGILIGLPMIFVGLLLFLRGLI